MQNREWLMPKFSTLILTALFVVGATLSLIQLYAGSDGLQHPFIASLYYFVTAILMISSLFKFRRDTSKIVLIINNLVITLFTVASVIFALICLYALEPEGSMDSLAGAIFFIAGMLASSAIFFAGANANGASAVSDRYGETSSRPQAI
jgi:hypothetical protein